METSLSPNDLSQFIAPTASLLKFEFTDIFSRLRPGQFGPKGTYTVKHESCTHVMSLHIILAIALFKKHYDNLWRSFPEDYMVTLSTLCDIFKIDEDTIELITLLPTSEQSNRMMLDYILFIMKGEDRLMNFCDLMELLINNKRLSKIVTELRNGETIEDHVVTLYRMCMYVNLFVYSVSKSP